jgi:L-iditol 2-dehydrogenase
MRAAVLYGQEDLRLEERDLLPLQACGLRLRVLTCGICGSDARMFFTGPTPRYIQPVILGHEFSGQVVEVGPEVADLGPGDVVTVAPLAPCMHCDACARGEDNLCERALVVGCTMDGGMSEYFTVPGQMVQAGGIVKLPPGIDHRAGALAELVGCCLRGLEQMSIQLGDRVLIIGDGPIGLTFLQLVKLMGVKQVVTSGRRPGRRQLALELGADEALDARATNLLQDWARAFDRVIVATSNIEATAEALELVRPGGHLLLFSGYTYGTVLPLDANLVHYRELHLHGSIDCTIQDFCRAVKLLPQLRMDRLISASYPLEGAEEAFRATKEQDAVKIILEP